MKSITVYCGSSTKLDRTFHEAAKIVGKDIAQNNLRLIYGGGSIGLMGTLAASVKQNGGEVIGIITSKFVKLEQANNECNELIVTDTIQERRTQMINRGDGFLMLPGGIGTYEEFFEVLVGRQINDHSKPIGIVNINGYFEPLLTMLEHGIHNGFIRPALRKLILIDELPSNAVNNMLLHKVNQPTPEEILPMHQSRQGENDSR